MSWTDTSLLYLAILVGCMLGGVTVGATMGIVTLVGLALVSGTSMWLSLADIVWSTTTNFNLVSIPLFILMGEVILHSGIAGRFYNGAAGWFRRVPGGLAQTNIVGCAVFSALAGSSVATALTMGSVALKEMRKRGYSDRLTFGSLTAGGCLGVLIPPSIPLIVYGAMTSESVISLFMAGLVPGLLLALLFSLFIAIKSWVQKDLVPAEKAAAMDSRQRLESLRDVLPVILLITVIIAAMYFGVVTPTEASAFGVLMAVLLAVAYRQMTWARLLMAVRNTLLTSAVIMFIVICANMLSFTLLASGVGRSLSTWLVAQEFSPLMFFSMLVLIYLVVGMFVDGLSIMLLTVPLLYEPALAMGFDGIWMGIMIVVFIELGALTPPMGLNLFAIQSVAPGAKLGAVARSSMPYCFIILGFCYLLYFIPQITLWLPQLMK